MACVPRYDLILSTICYCHEHKLSPYHHHLDISSTNPIQRLSRFSSSLHHGLRHTVTTSYLTLLVMLLSGTNTNGKPSETRVRLLCALSTRTTLSPLLARHQPSLLSRRPYTGHGRSSLGQRDTCRQCMGVVKKRTRRTSTKVSTLLLNLFISNLQYRNIATSVSPICLSVQRSKCAGQARMGHSRTEAVFALCRVEAPMRRRWIAHRSRCVCIALPVYSVEGVILVSYIALRVGPL